MSLLGIDEFISGVLAQVRFEEGFVLIYELVVDPLGVSELN
jgi:hypothetical protein